MVQIRFHSDVLLEGLNYVLVAKLDLRVEGTYAQRHLQSFVQGLANLLVGKHCCRLEVSYRSEVL